MTWPSGSSGGSGSGWGGREPDETRPAPPAPGASSWSPGATSGSGGWGGGSTAPATDPGDAWLRPGPNADPTATMVQSGPPLVWLVAAAVVPLLAACLFVLTGPVVNGIGWAVSAFGAVALLGVFQAQDLSRRASNWYAAQDSVVSGLRLVILLLALGVATGHAVFLAFWIARLDVFA